VGFMVDRVTLEQVFL
jgi:hypothetical protein